MISELKSAFIAVSRTNSLPRFSHTQKESLNPLAMSMAVQASQQFISSFPALELRHSAYLILLSFSLPLKAFLI